MARKQITLCLVLSAILALITACDFIPDEEFYNNSGKDLMITLFSSVDGEIHKRESFPLKSGESTFIGVPFKLEVQQGVGTWSYDLKWIPYKFYGAVGWNRRMAKLQIQEDGSIYILSPNSAAPATNFPPQPPDFPLVPRERTN